MSEKEVLNNILGKVSENTMPKVEDVMEEVSSEMLIANKRAEVLSQYDSQRQQQILSLYNELDTTSEVSVKTFGQQLTQALGSSSDRMLEKTKINTTDKAGELLNDLMWELENISKPTKKPTLFNRLLGKAEKKKYEIESNFETVKGRIDGISENLSQQNELLIGEIKVVDEIIDNNRNLELATDIYIKAGELKLEELSVLIPEMQKELEDTKDTEKEQELMELTSFYDRLDKKVNDLMLTKQVLKQSYPQLSLMKNTSYAVSEKIDSSLTHAINLWKNQMVITSTLETQRNAVQAVKKVSDTTNALLVHNSQLLKENSIETAKQNERGIVDLDTLEKVQNDLIETIRETVLIQKQGREERANSKVALERMDEEMKQKLQELASEIGFESQRARKTVYDSTQLLGHNSKK